jgi:aspartyl/asparaginyl-tRNA synthetase
VRFQIIRAELFSEKTFCVLSVILLFDYPASIKAFYMRLNEDGKKFMPWTFFSWDREIRGSQRRAFCFVENESIGNDEEEFIFRY